MSLSRLTQRTVTLRVELDGETVDVRARPMGAMDAARAERDLEEQIQTGSTESMTDCMVRILAERLVDEDDRAALPDLPMQLLSAIFRTLTGGSKEDGAAGKCSITRG